MGLGMNRSKVGTKHLSLGTNRLGTKDPWYETTGYRDQHYRKKLSILHDCHCVVVLPARISNIQGRPFARTCPERQRFVALNCESRCELLECAQTPNPNS